MALSLNALSIKSKLFCSTAIFLTLLGFTAGYGLYGMAQIGEELESISKRDIPLKENITKITRHQLAQTISFEQALRLGKLMQREKNMIAQYKTSVAHFDELGENINKEFRESKTLLETTIKNARRDEDIKEFTHIDTALKKIAKEHQNFTLLVHQVFALLAQENLQAAEALAEKIQNSKDQLNKEFDTLLGEIGKFTEQTEIRAAEHQKEAVVILSIIAAIGTLVGIFVSWLLVRSITGGLSKVARSLQAIASGDLTGNIEVQSQDEIGQLQLTLKNMNEKLIEIVGQVNRSAGSVNTATNEIAQGNADLSQRTEEQASSLEETASSMEQMTSSVKQSADNARQANQLATKARDQAENGNAVVEKAVSAMNEIEKSSKTITDITNLIDEIAFQTNLLALNAGVEAARAGEQGRGFAVVATEVRSLAGRSSEAAKRIKELITSSAEKVKLGADLVETSGKSLAEIVISVKKVTDVMAEITAASQEQASGIGQVNKAVNQMDEVTQQNAALVEEAAAASKAMAEQTNELVHQIAYFKIDGALTDNAPHQRLQVAQVAQERRDNSTRPFSKPHSPSNPTKSNHDHKSVVRTGTDDNEWDKF